MKKGINAVALAIVILVLASFVMPTAEAGKVKKEYIVDESLKQKLVKEGCVDSGKLLVSCSEDNGAKRGLIEDRVVMIKEEIKENKEEAKAIKERIKEVKQKIKKDKGKKKQPLIVAVIGTGVNGNHPELLGKVLSGKSFVESEPDPWSDEFKHDTGVAGRIGAEGINPEYRGVNPNVTILPGKVFDKYGIGSWSKVIDAIKWATDYRGTKVIVLSFNGGTYSGNCDDAIPDLTAAIRNATTKGISVYASSGNAGEAGVGAPACITGVTGVGGIDANDIWAWFSGVGDVDLVALATDVPIITADGGYGYSSGTSFANPFVAGAGTRILEKNQRASPQDVERALVNTAVDLGTPGWDPYYGWGKVALN